MRSGPFSGQIILMVSKGEVTWMVVDEPGPRNREKSEELLH